MQRRGRLNPARPSIDNSDADISGNPPVVPTAAGSRSLLRDLNVSLLIELVHRSGPISRADLARQSGLQRADGLDHRRSAARSWDLHRSRNGTVERRSATGAAQSGPESSAT